MKSERYKIALISAFIGNGGGRNTEISLTPECEKELQAYEVDVFRFNDENVDLLKPYFVPEIKKEGIYKQSWLDKLEYNFNAKFRFKQKLYPTEEDNYTRLIAKIPKIMFYKVVPNDYDYYIWCDSKFTLCEHWLKYVLFLIDRYSKYDILVSEHSERTSIRQELDYMVYHIKKYNDKNLSSRYNMNNMHYQVKSYLSDKRFNDNKLFELGCIIYSKRILQYKNFLEEWYAHNYYYTIQDQLSFPYLCRKHNVNVLGVKQRIYDLPFTTYFYGHLV